MNTAFLLMAQYNGLAVIPVASVVRDYFPHLTPELFRRKIAIGEINLPLVRIEPKSQKAATGVHITQRQVVLVLEGDVIRRDPDHCATGICPNCSRVAPEYVVERGPFTVKVLVCSCLDKGSLSIFQGERLIVKAGSIEKARACYRRLQGNEIDV
mgnify:CR=1 FL=1